MSINNSLITVPFRVCGKIFLGNKLSHISIYIVVGFGIHFSAWQLRQWPLSEAIAVYRTEDVCELTQLSF